MHRKFHFKHISKTSQNLGVATKATTFFPAFLFVVVVVFAGAAQEVPQLTDQYSLGGWPNGAVLNGDYAYLAQSFHLSILDITGETMQKIGSFDLPHEPNLLFINGNYPYAFYQWSDSSLQVVDISDPLKPVLLKRYKLSS